jgi:hypothetical protein
MLSVLLFFMIPSQPTYIDALLMFIGFISGIPVSILITRMVRRSLSNPKTMTKSEYEQGMIRGIIISLPIVIFSLWFGGQFIVGMSLIALPCFLTAALGLLFYYWRHRPHN